MVAAMPGHSDLQSARLVVANQPRDGKYCFWLILYIGNYAWLTKAQSPLYLVLNISGTMYLDLG